MKRVEGESAKLIPLLCASCMIVLAPGHGEGVSRASDAGRWVRSSGIRAEVSETSVIQGRCTLAAPARPRVRINAAVVHIGLRLCGGRKAEPSLRVLRLRANDRAERLPCAETPSAPSNYGPSGRRPGRSAHLPNHLRGGDAPRSASTRLCETTIHPLIPAKAGTQLRERGSGSALSRMPSEGRRSDLGPGLRRDERKKGAPIGNAAGLEAQRRVSESLSEPALRTAGATRTTPNPASSCGSRRTCRSGRRGVL